MLACGGPRSILYFLWCEGRSGAEKFRFTCCDLETVVLARNILLLSLMLDHAERYVGDASKSSDAQLSAIWNLWYHWSISEENLGLVRDQSWKVLLLQRPPKHGRAVPVF